MDVNLDEMAVDLTDLRSKIWKLEKFIEKNRHKDGCDEKRFLKLAKVQLSHMRNYAEILENRLEMWKNKTRKASVDEAIELSW